MNIIPFRGYFVAPLTVAEFNNLQEVQLMVDPSAAGLAAERASPEQVENLEKWASYKYKGRESYYEFLDQNRSLHVGIAEAAANDRLVEIVSNVHTRLMRYFYLGLSMQSFGDEIVKEHRRDCRRNPQEPGGGGSRAHARTHREHHAAKRRSLDHAGHSWFHRVRYRKRGFLSRSEQRKGFKNRPRAPRKRLDPQKETQERRNSCLTRRLLRSQPQGFHYRCRWRQGRSLHIHQAPHRMFGDSL